jgi:signal transduction histidine kinase
MTATLEELGIHNLPAELTRRKRIILGELRQRTLWFIRLRWWVPPSIFIGIVVARLIGVVFSAAPLLLTALFILLYNVFLYFFSRRLSRESVPAVEQIQRFTYYQVSLDYASMFLLIHFTGGAASPFIFFFIFHIIFASMLLPPRSAYGFATLAAELGFFTASVFITAYSTTSIMRELRRRILDLAELSESISALINKLNTLYTMIQAIGNVRNLEKLLNLACSELARVMEVEAISVKLLSGDGKRLNYAAAHGLPPVFIKTKVVDIYRSPLNRRILEGESFITSEVTPSEMFQFGEDLAACKLRSVLFVPLRVEEKVIGILGAYCARPGRFGKEEVEFFCLAAGLVAIALENVRYYETVEKMMQERSWFMMRVAHNLRAPLAAAISILNVVMGDYLGDLNERQASYLRRLDYPIRNMLSIINELMVLYAQRSEKKPKTQKLVDVGAVIGRVQRTFQAEAESKGLKFEFKLAAPLPPINGDEEMIEQMVENLVSNAIKYTRPGGEVKVQCDCEPDDSLCLKVCDNGIGIPQSDLPNIFNEFFRAPNAKEMERVGTGLGLPIVKEIVDQHGGSIEVESREGRGSTFLVRLKSATAASGAGHA